VRPIEVIVALKNLAVAKGVAPEAVAAMTENITKAGVSGIITPAVQKIRERLGLEPLGEYPVDEMLKLLED
jgi:heterodisulfide reductase subunit C